MPKRCSFLTKPFFLQAGFERVKSKTSRAASSSCPVDTGPQHSQRWKLLLVAPRADSLIPKWGGFFKFMLPIRNKQDRVKSSEIFPNKLPKQQTGSAEVFLTSGSTVISNSVCPGKHTDLCVRGVQQRVYGLFKLPNWLVEKWSCHFYVKK